MPDLPPEQVSSAPKISAAQFHHDGMGTFCNKQLCLRNSGDECPAGHEVTAPFWIRLTVPQWASVKLSWHVLGSL